jgi:hypothetical protein
MNFIHGYPTALGWFLKPASHHSPFSQIFALRLGEMCRIQPLSFTCFTVKYLTKCYIFSVKKLLGVEYDMTCFTSLKKFEATAIKKQCRSPDKEKRTVMYPFPDKGAE